MGVLFGARTNIKASTVDFLLNIIGRRTRTYFVTFDRFVWNMDSLHITLVTDLYEEGSLPYEWNDCSFNFMFLFNLQLDGDMCLYLLKKNVCLSILIALHSTTL